MVELGRHAGVDALPVRAHDDAAQYGLVDALAQDDVRVQIGFGFFRNDASQGVVQRNRRRNVHHAQVQLALQLLCVVLEHAGQQRGVAPFGQNRQHVEQDRVAASEHVPGKLAPLLGRINRQHLQIDEQMDELQRQQTEFSQITSSMREGLVLLDEKEHVLSINPAAEKLFGTDESCVGQDFLTIDRSHDMSLAIERAMDEGHSEARVERGGRIWQFDVSRIGASGAAVGAVLLAFDITERETAEQTRREFTANVSHELKTPLQGIIGSAELLENGMVKQEDVPRFVGHIRKEAQRLVTLIGDIIRLSQLDEGDEMPRETVDLLTLSQEAADDLKTAAAEKHIAIAVEGGSETIGGVRRLLYEVIYNLCDNAIKYNVEGGSMKVSVGERDGKAFVSVADTGIGIAPEHQSRIFERFYRVDKSHSKASGGTGLGLSIVKHAVQYHHGTVELHSEEGKGTTICILLPKE
mgnify:CR=1 FL=1